MHLISRPADSRFPYLPGIDALRALAVLAVFGYHAGVGWLPGGFLGVDLFFTISGYLIASLLLAELRRDGRISLGSFWLRRARRLLPAVGVLIAVTIVLAAIFEPGRLDEARGDALASLFYAANWHFVIAEVPYFEQFQRPSLFTHLWSLSVEEQFYLLWPLVFAAGMRFFGRTRLLVGVIAGALGSVVLAWVLFDPGGDASRVYYGTDTHAVGLLAGVALALVWSPVELRRREFGPLTGRLLDALGVAALAFVVLALVRVHDYDLGLYHGGYLWLALLVAALLAALAHPAARLGGLLGRGPAIWLGLRSYSFYLWHWPVLALTRPGLDVDLPRGVLIPLQLALVLVLADLSYRYVELPFRGRGGLSPAMLRIARPALLVGTLAIVVAIGWSGLFGSERDLSEVAASTARSATIAPRQVAGGSPATPTGAGGQKRADEVVDWPRIVALGDSVMVGAAEKLAGRLGPGFSLNAEVSRQANEFVEIVERLRREGHRPDATIIQMGNNGPLYGEDMAAIQRATADVGHLFLINDRAPVSWIPESNRAIAEAGRDWPHTTVIDWKRVADAHPNLLWDSIHLTPAGAGVYARLVSAVVHAVIPFPPPSAIANAIPAR